MTSATDSYHKLGPIRSNFIQRTEGLSRFDELNQPYISRREDTDDSEEHEKDVALGRHVSEGRFVRDDIVGVLFVMSCFALSVTAVAQKSLAFRLGLTNQLIVVGALLSIMAFVTLKKAQSLLLVLEARFGSSRLQNFQAIIQDEKFSRQSSGPVKLCLIFLFALPLALSASYKRFTGGRTTATSSHDEVIHFGPTEPPGLFIGDGLGLFHNITSALYTGREGIFNDDLPNDTSFGYNMHVINTTTTAILDMPLASNMSAIQARLPTGVSLTLSAYMNATFARLNSTPETPERSNLDYWSNIVDRFASNNSGHSDWYSRGLGGGTWFSMWSGWIDSSLVFVSYTDAKVGETVENTAYAFDIYRGTAEATWTITRNSVRLVHAADFQTNFSPNTRHPEISRDHCNITTATDMAQKAIYCRWDNIGAVYYQAAPAYFVGPWDELDQTYHPSPVSVWVAVVAAAAASELVSAVKSFGTWDLDLLYLIHTPKYSVSSTVPTLSREWGLYATLATQPCLLILILSIRYCLRSTPVSPNFGLVTLLAGVERDSLEALRGASYSGELRGPVQVLFTNTIDPTPSEELKGVRQNIVYTLRIPKRTDKSR